ncbi:MAG: hypothetical protein Q4E61_02200 [Alphaproteobacteria bacterium]|nr:hypothetical protein [Alphaproteobacteria bacterium]
MQGLSLLLIKQHINLTNNAVISANNVYKIANTKKLSSNTANVTIKKIAKNVAATNIGDCNSFCKTIDNIIVATGIAKNINKLFIRISPIQILYIVCS